MRYVVTLTLIFKVPPGARGHSKNCCALGTTKTHSLRKGIPGPRRLMQKRQLFPELRRASQSHFTLPCQVRGPERFRYQVEEYGPHSLSAERAVSRENFSAALNKASPKP